MMTPGWDHGRLLSNELTDARYGFSAFFYGDRSRGLAEEEGLEEAHRHLLTFMMLESSSQVFVPKNVRLLVRDSLDALERNKIEVALIALDRACRLFEQHREREAGSGPTPGAFA